MKTEDFDFYLPEHLIAQVPLERRSASKLLLLDKQTGDIMHQHFTDITSFLRAGDVLVLNNTKVMPARILGVKEETGAVIELLILKDLSANIWECLVKPAKRVKVGTTISFGNGQLKAICTEEHEEGIRHFKLEYEGILFEILDALGQMPLPPYITEKLEDNSRYQTVYAKHVGSAAAPTAGLHFTNELLQELRNKGIIITEITLHVGLGTFRPVSVTSVNDHKMHEEFYQMEKETAEILNRAKEEERRIISVGTTTTRTLESVYRDHQKFMECSGFTDIFIYPGKELKAIDGLITNFHLPKSTLIMLVSALASKESVMHAYEEAVKREYRFFSFGDSMFIGNHHE